MQHNSEIVSSLISAIQIPELDETRRALATPQMKQYAQETEASYLDIIGKLSSLSQADIALITKARKACLDAGISLSSASDKGADDLVNAIGPDVQRQLIEFAQQAVTKNSDLYNRGLEELKKRMTKGHDLAVQGKTLADGDPEADTVIWGHTKGLQPKAIIHFVLCHFLERTISFALQDSPNKNAQEFGRGKDYFLNAMNDVIRLETARGNKYPEIIGKWIATREEGGLEWSNKDKQQVFSAAV